MRRGTMYVKESTKWKINVMGGIECLSQSHGIPKNLVWSGPFLKIELKGKWILGCLWTTSNTQKRPVFVPPNPKFGMFDT